MVCPPPPFPFYPGAGGGCPPRAPARGRAPRGGGRCPPADAEDVGDQKDDCDHQNELAAVHPPDCKWATYICRRTTNRHPFCGPPTNPSGAHRLAFEAPHPLRGASLRPSAVGGSCQFKAECKHSALGRSNTWPGGVWKVHVWERPNEIRPTAPPSHLSRQAGLPGGLE